MRKFHPLKITALDKEAADAVCLSLEVPEALRNEFVFLPGQHLPVQVLQDGKPVRRTYSICSVPDELPLRLGIRIQPGGQFSEYVRDHLAVDDTLEVMPPFGQFHATSDPDSDKTYVAFAAGSGITPILSILRATLETAPQSRFVLFYGNRRQQTTMFIEELYALKNRFADRLQLYFLFSQEEQEFDIFHGRLDESSVPRLVGSFCVGLMPDEAFICGPDTMSESVKRALLGLGMDADSIHVERFGAPRKVRARVAARSAKGETARVDIVMDGHRKSFDMAIDGTNIVDAAASHGIELPYSCKGGVCATCRTFVTNGEVQMDTNYGLEPWEVEKGFVLACQSVPVSSEVTIDYDKV